MQKYPCLIVLLLLLCPGLQARIELPVTVDSLDNGLTLLICPDTTAPTVSVQTFVNCGSRDEDRAGITGLAHVFEHMMFRGTERYPDYHAAVARFGSQNNAYTTEDYTCYFVNAPAEFLEPILDIESDRIRRLDFTREAFRTELGPVKEERRRGEEDSPEGWLEVELLKLAYTTHTYQHPVIGWEEDLEVNMTFEDGLEFKNRFYVPNNCVLSVCGNFEVAELKNLIVKYFGEWERGVPYTPQIESEPPQEHERVQNYVWKDAQTVPLLQVAWHTGAAGYDLQRLAALQLLSDMLCSRSGRLTSLLKNDLAWVESIDADAQLMKDPGLFLISARLVATANLQVVTDTILAQLEKLKQTPVSAAELTRARNSRRAQLIYRLERP
ncbi:MAG: pitrilysin family protein, partial [bacterium]